jgi:tetratricopeptide (TPR) repeat protein
VRAQVEALLRDHAASPVSPTPTDPETDDGAAATGSAGRSGTGARERVEAAAPASPPPTDPEPTESYLAPSEAPGSVLAGRYKLLGPLGEGGMGTVFLARQVEPVKREVAVKVIQAGMSTKQVLARFEAERQALALMDHPNIAKVLDAGTTDAGRPFFVMEVVKGVPITRFCDDHRLTPWERLELFLPVCRAVQHAHQKGIIHRDIKPSNILVTLSDDRPVPKVIDFGVAKAIGQPLTDMTLATGLGSVVGTPEYMSPEQASFDNTDVDTRSDVYSLGVLLYELLAGSPPFRRSQKTPTGLLEVLRAVREVDPPRPSARLTACETLPTIAANRAIEPAKLARLLSGELDWVVMKALEKDRTRRYQTAISLAQDVERYLADEVVEARPPGARYRLQKFVRRHRVSVFAAGAVALALVLAIVGTTTGLFEAQRQKTAALTALGEKEKARAGEAAERRKAQQQLVRAENERMRADAERDSVKAINDFLLNDLLNQANWDDQTLEPGQEKPRDTSIGKLLDTASKAVEGKFPDRPIIEAAVRHTVGETYRIIGEAGPARGHLERALELRKSSLGPDDPATLDTQQRLAQVYSAEGDYDRAQSLISEVVKGRTSKLGPQHEETLFARNILVSMYSAKGRLVEAEKLSRALLDEDMKVLGPLHRYTQSVQHLLATICIERGKLDEAEQLVLEQIKLRTDRQGADHPNTLVHQVLLARIYMRQRKLDEAEALLKTIVPVAVRVLGEDNPQTLGVKGNLGLIHEQRGRYDLAEPLFQQVLAGRKAKQGPDNPATLVCQQNLSRVYLRQEKYDLAEPLLRDTLKAQTAKLGADHRMTLATSLLLAELYMDQGKYDLAEPTLAANVSTLRSQLGLSAPQTQGQVRALIECYQRMGRPARAEPLCREMMEHFQKSAGPEAPAYVVALAILGRNLNRQERWTESERMLRDALAILDKNHAKGWRAALTQSLLGASLLGQKNYADAEPLLLAGYAGLKAAAANMPPADRPFVAEAADRLVELYNARGKPDEAARWQTERETLRKAEKHTGT